MATKTVKKEFTMEEVCSLWKRESKKGEPYFNGKTPEGIYVTGFFNTNKKNPKEPDLRLYLQTENGIEKEPFASMWCNVSEKSGKKYLTGKLGEKRIVGFINDEAESKKPYVRVYYSEDKQQKISVDAPANTEPTTEAPKKTTKQKAPF